MSKPNIFISGGAQGIGCGIAEYFAAKGWEVGIYDVDLVSAEKLAQKLNQQYGAQTARAGGLDVREAGSWQEALAEFCRHGTLHALVNNAGILSLGDFANIPLDKHRALIEVNIQGVMQGSYLAHPYLKKAGQACLVNLSSASAIYGQPQLAVYSASKFFVAGLSEALDLEWEKDQIRVRSIWPLFVNTAMGQVAVKTKSGQQLGLRLTAEDVAKTVFAAVQSPSRQVHWSVGWQTQFFRIFSRFLPDGLARTVNKRLVD